MIKELKKCFKNLISNLKKLNKNILYVKKQCNKSYIYILFDMLFSTIKYDVNDEEYKLFEFYNLDKNKRNTYLTNYRHDKLKKYLYDKNIINILNDKNKLLKRFKDVLKREVYNINDLSFKEFEELSKSSDKLLCRSVSNSFVKTYKVFDVNDYRSSAFMAEDIKKNKLFLVEKYFKNNKVFDELDSDLVVINVVTLYNKRGVSIISSSIKFKDKDKIISGSIDIKNKTLEPNLKDEKFNNYKKVNKIEIPYFDKIIDLSKKLSCELSEIKEIEWSFCINGKNIYLMDASLWNDYTFAQLRDYRKFGLMSFYNKNKLK